MAHLAAQPNWRTSQTTLELANAQLDRRVASPLRAWCGSLELHKLRRRRVARSVGQPAPAPADWPKFHGKRVPERKRRQSAPAVIGASILSPAVRVDASVTNHCVRANTRNPLGAECP